ncbi:MAG: hypothetical protein H6839_06885 [Planctomycetes bacterium]|nr:hypothetical protein [Planctomycetota bacterium]
MASGATLDLGEHFNKEPYDLIIRIQNVGSTDLTLDTSLPGYPCEVSAESGVNCILNQPAGATIPAGTYLEFTISLKPTANAAWSSQLDVHSDDPDESPYTITFMGVSTKKDGGSDESCSTGAGTGLSGIAMLGLMSLLGLAVRAARRRVQRVKISGASMPGGMYTGSYTAETSVYEPG